MKNTLSENMLRFGTKNLSAAGQKELIVKSIMETINQHGLNNVIRKKLTEQTRPKPGTTVEVDSPSKGSYDAPVPTDSATLGNASKIVGQLMTAFGGIGTDDVKAKAAIYAINSPQLYYAVLWTVQNSGNLRAEYGKNFRLVGEFLSEDIKFASGTSIGGPGNPRTIQSPSAAYQQLTGAQSQYKDYERHLQQFNTDEYIQSEPMSDR